MKANYVVYSDGIESMAYLDQERGVERLRDIFHGKIEHSWLCREPTV